MRRTLSALPMAALFGLALHLTPAPAQNPPPRPSPLPGPASPFVNARADFGARGDGVADDGPAIQRAIDGAAATARLPSGYVQRAEVYLPAGVYNLASGPLYLDADNVSLRGDGAMLVQMRLCPAIAVGVPRNDGGKVADTTYRPGGAALATRGRYGPAYLKFAGGPLDLGQNVGGAWDHYGKTSQFTVDLCLRLARKAGQFVCGSGSAGGLESPWAVWVPGDNPDVVVLSYKTSAQRPQNDSPFQARVSLAGLDRGQPFNIAFQVDLAANRVWAWRNGIRVDVDNNGDRRTPGPAFLDNEGVNPFTVGVSAPYDVTNAGPDTVADMTLFGLSAAACLKYKDVPVGGPQLRSDNGQPADQGYRVNPWTLPGLLDSIQPSVVVGDPKFVRTQKAFGFLCFPNSARFSRGNRLSGLHVRHNSTGILFGTVLNQKWDDLAVDGGTRGIASFSGQSSYTLYANRLNLSGGDTPLFLRWCDFIGKEIEFDTSGSDSVRASDSSVALEHVRVWFPGADQQRIISGLGGQYGGRWSVRDMLVDFEGNSLSDCGMLFRQTAYTPGQVILDDVTLGTVGPHPLIRLDTWDNSEFNVGWRCVADINNVVTFDTNYTSFVEANGLAWHGRASAPYLRKGLKFTPGPGLGAATVPDLDVRVGK